MLGITWTVSYEVDGYIYTITNITADHVIVVAASGSGPEMYVKLNGTWTQVARAYRKVYGAWQQIAFDQAFTQGTNYVKG